MSLCIDVKFLCFLLSSTKALPELRWELLDSGREACPFRRRHCHMSKVRSKDFLDAKDYYGNPPLKSRFYPVITRLTTQLRYNRNSITCVLKL